MTAVAYLDTSALAKLVRVEAETDALRDWLRGANAPDVVASSAITTVELIRAARRSGADAAPVALRVLAGLSTVAVSPSVLGRAADLPPPALRSLDAIHLATAMEIGSSLSAIVAYDVRLLDAARELGLPVVSPC